MPSRYLSFILFISLLQGYIVWLLNKVVAHFTMRTNDIGLYEIFYEKIRNLEVGELPI